MKSPLQWPGGKARLAETILSYLPEHQAYVETCCGGAAVFWAKPKEISKIEILNDADGELINFYQVLHKRGRRLAREVDAVPYSRAVFNRMLASRGRSGFQRAVRFWYLNRVAFGAMRHKPTFGVIASRGAYVLPRRTLDGLDSSIERLRGVSFEAIDVCHLLRLYDRRTTLFYVDPPFYGTSQDYAVQFAAGDHERLVETLRSIDGTFLLSYNDCHHIRRLYRGFRRRRLSTRYTIGCNSSTGGRDRATELLISNRPLGRRKTPK